MSEVEVQPESNTPVSDSTPDRVQIYLVDDEETKSCDFWIGLFSKGPHTPNLLFYKSSLLEIFDVAAKEGLSEAEPIMLSDATENTSKYIYLLPDAKSGSEEELAWVKQSLQAVQACKATTVGIYLSLEVLKDVKACELALRILLNTLVKHSSARHFALYPGDYGTNSVLNTALSIKLELQNKLNIETYVYH